MASTTTTTSRGARDLRRPITSPITATILLTLYEAGWATTEELAEVVEDVTGQFIRAKDVLSYLRYYQRKGWVTSGSPFWGLTDEGREFVRKYERWLRRLIGEFLQVGESLVSHTKRDETLSYGILKKTKDDVNALIEKIRQYVRNKDEEDVLRILLEHFLETGSTYMYLDELAERMQTTPSLLYQEILRSMKARRLIYVWKDGKVGLGRLVRRVLGLDR